MDEVDRGGLIDIMDPENAPAGHGRWHPEAAQREFELTDDDGCWLFVSANDAADMIAVLRAGAGLRAALLGEHDAVCSCAADGTDPDCNYRLDLPAVIRTVEAGR